MVLRRPLLNGLLLALFGLWCTAVGAQSVSISESNSPPDPSAMLDVQSLTKGMLIPRMTESHRLAIAAPANGLIVYQTSNTTNSRRGFWYYEATESEWIHLGRGEYTGVVQQPNTLVSSSHAPPVTAEDVGENLIHFFPPYSVAPSVVITPEFTVVGEPPAIDEYCTPVDLTCNFIGRMDWIRVHYPETSFAGNTNDHNNPPIAANFGSTCPNMEQGNYGYVPYDGPGTEWTNNYASFNSLEVELLCNDPSIGFLMHTHNSNPKSFSFFVDLNQDGDFNDADELIDTRTNLNPQTSSLFYFGSANPAMYPPITIPLSAADGMTKMRIIIRENNPPITNPCFVGDGFSKFYDFDVKITCGSGPAFYPNDLNWCNVSDVTTSSARVSCFDKNGTPTDLKYHYKIIVHD